MNDLFEYKEGEVLSGVNSLHGTYDEYHECRLKRDVKYFRAGQHFNKIKIYKEHPIIEFTSKFDFTSHNIKSINLYKEIL